jgi:hypothetical protein
MDGLTFNAENHQYLLNGVPLPSVTQILSDLGFIDKSWFTDYGRTRGKFVHLACELDDRNELEEESLDSTLLPYLTAWRAFKRDTGFIVSATEKPVVNTIYNFAGTLDRIGTLNSCDAVIDIKSGAVSPWTALQLAAYEIAENRRLKRFAVQLLETGKYKLHSYANPQDRQIFLAAVSCWHWINNNKKGK